jgi:non-ribosomal peptide synthetase component E (peptide arylation enzyme)
LSSATDDDLGEPVAEVIHDATTFWQLLDLRVAASPDRRMLIDDTGRSLTFAQFRDRAERVAAGFMALGVVEATPVTWILPTRIKTILVSVALSRLGAVQNPIIHLGRHRETSCTPTPRWRLRR